MNYQYILQHDVPWKHYAKQNEPIKKTPNILWFHLYMFRTGKHGDKTQLSGCLGLHGRQGAQADTRVTANGYWFLFEVMKMFYNWLW